MSNTLSTAVIQAIRNRRGLLWVCQRHDLLPGQEPHDYGLPTAEASLRYRRDASKVDVALASLYWEGVWLEGAASPLLGAIRKTIETEPSDRRRSIVTLAGAPDAQVDVSQEFLPVCVLPGILDPSAPPAGRYGVAKRKARERIAWDLAARLAKYPGRTLVVLGARSPGDLSLLYEVLEDCPVTNLHVLLTCPDAEQKFDFPDNAGVDVTLWTASEEDLWNALVSAGVPSFRALPEWGIRYANRTLPLSVRDAQRIQKRFALIGERDLRPPEQFSMDDLQRFLRGDLTAWSAFVLDVPVERAYRSDEGKTLNEEVEYALSKVAEADEAIRTLTLRLPCDPGSGVTTIVRATAFAMAEKGYPALVLRPDQVDIDLEELVAFSTAVSEAGLKEDVKNPPPLLIALDVEHETIPDASLIADYLASHGRSAVVLQAISSIRASSRGESRRRRAWTLLPLSSTASPEEVGACAKKFEEIVDRWNLPITVPTVDSWSAYASAATMQSPFGKVEPQTMFWIALRFFLVEGMQFLEADKALDALGSWIRKRSEQVRDVRMLEVIKHVAALSAFRIVSPLWTVLRPVTGGSFDSSIVSILRQLEGVVEWGAVSEELHDQVLRFLHPTLAREFLRQHEIRSDDAVVATLKPVLCSLSPGHPGDVWVAETLAFTVLAPTHEERLQIVRYDWRLEAFNAIPPALSDQSKVILHHWARCLYHSVDPQHVGDIDLSVQRERIEAAIQKLERATGLPRREGRDEHPSHLYNTLGTAYARYAGCLEDSAQPAQVSEDAWDKACLAFRKSVELLPNIEALLGFSHRLLAHAQVLGGGRPEPTKDRIGQVAEALSLLDEVEELLEYHSNPQEEWWNYLHADKSSALDWLGTDLAKRYLEQLRLAERQDLAYFCEARLLLGRGKDVTQIEKALSIVEHARQEGIERSSPLLIFHLSLLRRHPSEKFNFGRLEELYSELAKTVGYTPRPIERFRHAVLCYQTGKYRDGDERFRRLREEFRKTGGPQFFDSDFWRDPHDPEKPRLTQIRITRIVTDWRAHGYVEELGQDVPLRPRHFTPIPKVREPVSCIIRFGPNGPLAVPPRFERF